MAPLKLTEGRPVKQIILFSLPLIGGSLFQQLYNFIDTLIVGRLIGVDAVAAIGAYYPLSFLIMGFVQGTCIGFSIPLSHSVGEENHTAVRQYLTNAMWLCLGLAVILTPLMVALTPTLLTALHTPNQILHLTIIFTAISFLGIPANILFNYSADALRSFGDAVHPLYFLIASLVVNVVLDLIFILIFHWGIAGAAIATVISEFIGGLLNLTVFPKFNLGLSRKDWALNWERIKKMNLIGLPMGFEYSVSAIGAIVMQDAINLLGTSIIAAQSAAEKIRQLFTLPMESVGAAMATYQAQNFGAKQRGRMKRGIIDGVWIQVIYSAAAFIIINLAKTPLVTAIIGPGHPDIIREANYYIIIISCYFPVHGILMIFRNTLQGWGHSFYAIFSGMGELIGRTAAGWLSIAGFGFTAIAYANPLAWGLALAYCIFMVFRVFRRKNFLDE
ncbi:MATE family efflux transporter [Levilactobacillus sp. N40-8-2]|uniref:MATE family efflux transporter n=1 Tax=Levilactobacillus muriae TaxID=3238987 RepID=UPI0038B340A2